MYEAFFGFSGKPFQLSPDARFFYPSKEHKRALSFLRYGLGQADGFIVITGDVGTGKTTLVQTLLDDLDPNSVMCANLVTTQLEENDLLSLVCINLGIHVDPTKSKALLLNELQRFFSRRVAEGRRVLIIVDEAQNLPARSVEELRMLSNFTHDGQPLVQVFLLGQEEFRGTLLSEGFEQLRQRVIATYHLNPLTREETQTYIEHRLSTVGWDGRPQFTDDAFDAIFDFSEGVPRRINNLCDRLLLFTFLEEGDSVDAEVVKSVGEEIGSEFWGRTPAKPRGVAANVAPESASLDATPEQDVFNSPGGLPHEPSAVQTNFERIDLQKRMVGLEQVVQLLTETIHEDLGQIRSILLRLVKNQARLSAGEPPLESEHPVDPAAQAERDEVRSSAQSALPPKAPSNSSRRRNRLRRDRLR
ncbi:MAG: XrtA/PEP-CTERM system-associated ATPase [Pseudomonadota bacterium]